MAEAKAGAVRSRGASGGETGLTALFKKRDASAAEPQSHANTEVADKQADQQRSGADSLTTTLLNRWLLGPSGDRGSGPPPAVTAMLAADDCPETVRAALSNAVIWRGLAVPLLSACAATVLHDFGKNTNLDEAFDADRAAWMDWTCSIDLGDPSEPSAAVRSQAAASVLDTTACERAELGWAAPSAGDHLDTADGRQCVLLRESAALADRVTQETQALHGQLRSSVEAQRVLLAAMATQLERYGVLSRRG